MPELGCGETYDRNGRGDWIRTSDLLNPIQVRYEAALRPDQNRYYHRGVRRINSPAPGANRTSPALNDLGNSDPMISGGKLACC